MEIGLCLRVCMCIEVMSGSLIGQKTALEFQALPGTKTTAVKTIGKRTHTTNVHN